MADCSSCYECPISDNCRSTTSGRIQNAYNGLECSQFWAEYRKMESKKLTDAELETIEYYLNKAKLNLAQYQVDQAEDEHIEQIIEKIRLK